ncbi:MAG: GTP-binding protein [Gammaproteobacteria bacterium (ex Lamellibrachia satsuma)]|nr:MAG: GTP-binding protein [Gammaproteobacteria bacterium (ex Lamellibrachia satsuma)]RRS33707.1 MAG: GTP-binding protein [Gammaproteobacteria bacterium (ex Lamellibrachia satsuma)]RRS34655.1 MAG: GTP-binding protein [Gammaproteobacteria bacterium (ex Lamellibrachia satsuma)]
MDNYKILIAGSVGAGKTTAISSVSNTPPLTTEALASDITQEYKETTTVAMDYGLMTLSGIGTLHLYGTPGEPRFDFMWDILSKGSVGLILLIDSSRTDPFSDLHFFLRSFKKFTSKNRVAIGITKMDLCSTPSIDEYQAQLRNILPNIPVFSVDARNHIDVALLIEALIFSLDPKLAA